MKKDSLLVLGGLVEVGLEEEEEEGEEVVSQSFGGSAQGLFWKGG